MKSERNVSYLMALVLSQLLHPCNSGRRCGQGTDYGDDCNFVPAPPGRTPACAAPGYTYCEQLDHYPNDLIRHLVDKGEYDFSTLLSDETRDDFAATRPSQGPYAYGPHSLHGIQAISLVTDKPAYQQKQPQTHRQPQEQFHPTAPYATNNAYAAPPIFGQKPHSPPSSVGYAGHQQRPLSQSYLPSHDSYLPPKVANSTLNSHTSVEIYQSNFPSAIRLDQYDDFWRGNPYFEVPKTPSFSNSNFHRNNFGSHSEYYDNNGQSPYYSTSRDSANAGYKTIPNGQTGWASDNKQQQYSYREFVPPAVTTYNPNDWWKQQPNDQRLPGSSELSYKSTDSNDNKIRKISKRDTNDVKASKDKRNVFMNVLEEIKQRKKRQAPSNGDQLCPTRSQYITPRAALNKEGNWMYVVNMGADTSYSQLVKSEICVSQQCDGICSLPLGYTSRCEQRYVQKRLVALEPDGQRLYTDIFWFPSCCLCTISNNQT